MLFSLVIRSVEVVEVVRALGDAASVQVECLKPSCWLPAPPVRLSYT